MSRYIDAEWLKGEIRKAFPSFYMRVEINTLVNLAPSIEIVRCRECKHDYNKVLNHGKMKPRCDFTDRVLTENDFCSRGEREGE